MNMLTRTSERIFNPMRYNGSDIMARSDNRKTKSCVGTKANRWHAKQAYTMLEKHSSINI